MLRIVVRVFVPGGLLVGQRIALVPEVGWHRGKVPLLGVGHGRADGLNHGVALLRLADGDNGLGDGDLGLGHAHELQGLYGGMGLEHGDGVRQAHVLAGVHHDAAHNQLGVHPGIHHAAEPQERRVRVAAPHAFDESGEHVVIQVLVQLHHGLLHTFLGCGQGNEAGGGGMALVRGFFRGQKGQLQRPQRGAHIPSGHQGHVPQGAVLALHRVAAKAPLLIGQGPLQRLLHFLHPQGFKVKHPAAADNGRGHAGHGVFRSGADEADQPAFNGGKDAVALGLAPAVALVQQQIGGLALAQAALLGGGQHLAHIRHAAGNGVELFKGAAGDVRDNGGQRGFAAARRAPEDAALEPVRHNGPAKELPLPQQRLLADKLLQGAGAHALRQGRLGGVSGHAAP